MAEAAKRRWSDETDAVLRAAGWQPGRVVATDEYERVLTQQGGFTIHAAARNFLTEFGGLEVAERGPGVSALKVDFQINPALAAWDDEIFDVLSEEAGAYLYPVGMAGRRNSYIGMADDGRVFLGMDSAWEFAETGDRALEKLVEGVR